MFAFGELDSSKPFLSVSGIIPKIIDTTKVFANTATKGVVRALPTLAVMSVIGVLIANRYVAAPPQATQLAAIGSAGEQVVLDEIASADIAAGVAEVSGLLVADDALQYADSLKGESEMTASTEDQVMKPQIVKTDAKTRQDIEKYIVKKGESLSDIANTYNVTTDTIKWANDLSSNSVEAGTKLTILPVSGVLHTVDDGETAKEIADKYRANAEQIIAFNDAELTGLKSGMRIVVPEGEMPAPSTARRSFLGTRSGNFTSASYGSSSTFLGRYTKFGLRSGWCTDWAKYKAGIPDGQRWGNAYSWDESARNYGWNVSNTPRAGAVGQRPFGNHVVYIEAVSEDKKMVKYSDQNGLMGWGNAAVTNEWVPASGFRYIYR